MKTRFFISGSFDDTFDDMRAIKAALEDAGLSVLMKVSVEDPPSRDLIEDCQLFIAVVGLAEGFIKTPAGDTLPQAELTYAIRRRKPVIAFIKEPETRSPHPKQEHLRKMLRLRLGAACLGYESVADIRKLCLSLLIAGHDAVAKPLKPLKVFMCHSSDDKPIVEDIARRLWQAEILTFYDKHDIGVGKSIRAEIVNAITEVGYLVVCLSPNSLSSDWVRREISWAIEHANRLGIGDDEFVLPARIAPVDIPDELAFLRDRKYADFAADFEVGLATLKAAILA